MPGNYPFVLYCYKSKGDVETTGAVIDLEFEMFLEQRDVSRVVWRLSQELRQTTGIEVRERPMLQPLTTPGEGLQLVSRGPYAEQILGEFSARCAPQCWIYARQASATQAKHLSNMGI